MVDHTRLMQYRACQSQQGIFSTLQSFPLSSALGPAGILDLDICASPIFFEGEKLLPEVTAPSLGIGMGIPLYLSVPIIQYTSGTGILSPAILVKSGVRAN